MNPKLYLEEQEKSLKSEDKVYTCVSWGEDTKKAHFYIREETKKKVENLPLN